MSRHCSSIVKFVCYITISINKIPQQYNSYLYNVMVTSLTFFSQVGTIDLLNWRRVKTFVISIDSLSRNLRIQSNYEKYRLSLCQDHQSPLCFLFAACLFILCVSQTVNLNTLTCNSQYIYMTFPLMLLRTCMQLFLQGLQATLCLQRFLLFQIEQFTYVETDDLLHHFSCDLFAS